MASNFEIASGLGTAAMDLFGGFSSSKAFKAQQKAYETARDIDYENADLVQENTHIKQYMSDRRVEQSIGKSTAAIAGNGFEAGGSNTYILREAAQQGHIENALIGLQGQIDTNAYLEKAAANEGMAKAASESATKSMVGGVFGAITSVGKLFF